MHGLHRWRKNKDKKDKNKNNKIIRIFLKINTKTKRLEIKRSVWIVIYIFNNLNIQLIKNK